MANAWSALYMSSSSSSSDHIIHSRQPHKTARGAFLGFRNTKDVPGLRQQLHGRSSSAQPIMPEGGLSPCVIRVLGVGGGGCNAVRIVGAVIGESLCPRRSLALVAGGSHAGKYCRGCRILGH